MDHLARSGTATVTRVAVKPGWQGPSKFHVEGYSGGDSFYTDLSGPLEELEYRTTGWVYGTSKTKQGLQVLLQSRSETNGWGNFPVCGALQFFGNGLSTYHNWIQVATSPPTFEAKLPDSSALRVQVMENLPIRVEKAFHIGKAPVCFSVNFRYAGKGLMPVEMVKSFISASTLTRTAHDPFAKYAITGHFGFSGTIQAPDPLAEGNLITEGETDKPVVWTRETLLRANKGVLPANNSEVLALSLGPEKTQQQLLAQAQSWRASQQNQVNYSKLIILFLILNCAVFGTLALVKRLKGFRPK